MLEVNGLTLVLGLAFIAIAIAFIFIAVLGLWATWLAEWIRSDPSRTYRK